MGYILTITALVAVALAPLGFAQPFPHPGGTPNYAPSISVSYDIGQGRVAIQPNDKLYVSYGDDLSALNIKIDIADANNDDCWLDGVVSGIGATGLDNAEWSQPTSPVSFTVWPATGVFNTSAGVTHIVWLNYNDNKSPQLSFTFEIEQSPQPPELAVSENGLGITHNAAANGTNRDFGPHDPAAGATAPLTITVGNTGYEALTLSGIALTGAGAGEFVLDTTSMASVVTTGGSTTFDVSFDPVTLGAHNAWVEVLHNDPNAVSPFRFEVSGAGLVQPAPIMIVREGGPTGAIVSNGGVASVGSLDVTNMPAAPLTIHIENGGNADLTLATPISNNSEFSVGAGAMLTTLAPGGTTTFTVNFSTTVAGQKSAAISVVHNDTSTATPFIINVTATATNVQGNLGVGAGTGGQASAGCTAGHGRFGIWALGLIALLGAAFLRHRTA